MDKRNVDNHHLFAVHPFNFGLRFTAVLDVIRNDLALFDDHTCETLADNEWLNCKSNE